MDNILNLVSSSQCLQDLTYLLFQKKKSLPDPRLGQLFLSHKIFFICFAFHIFPIKKKNKQTEHFSITIKISVEHKNKPKIKETSIQSLLFCCCIFYYAQIPIKLATTAEKKQRYSPTKKN